MPTKNKKQKKKDNNYKVIKKKSIKVLSQEFYDFMGSGTWNVTQPFLRKFAHRIRYYIDHYTILTIGELCWDHGITQQQYFQDWIPKSKELQEAHQYAMNVIGTRRELGALHKELETSTVNHKLNVYSYAYQQHKIKEDERVEAKEARLAKVRAEEKRNEGPSQQFIFVEKIPDTGIKPPEKDNE